MFKSLMVLLTLVIVDSALAAPLPVQVSSCEDRAVTLDQVVSFRTFGNERIKMFAIDQTEPDAAPMGVAVTILRGQNLSTFETYCRYASGLSDLSLEQARSSYDASTNKLTVTIPAKRNDVERGSLPGTLTLIVSPGANEADLTTASFEFN